MAHNIHLPDSPGPVITVTDNANGTVTTDAGTGGVQAATRPISELALLSGSIDTTSDRIMLYDASTGFHVYVTPSMLSQPEVFRNNGPLSGPVPTGYNVGVDYSTGTQYYRNASNNWQAFPAGTTVVLTDLASGVLSINAGLGGTQTAIRPLSELGNLVGALDTATDRLLVYDASTGNHVYVNPSQIIPRATLAVPFSDGVGSTRAGAVGTSTSLIYSPFDHVHPILAITAPTTPTVTVSSGALTITTSTVATANTEEENVTFRLRVQCTIPAHTNVWQVINIPNIAGYKAPITTIQGVYRQSGSPAGWPAAPCMAGEATVWTPNLIYIGGITENTATVRHLLINVTYTIA